MEINNEQPASVPMPLQLNKAAWLEALAALELEFIAYQNRRSSPITGDIDAVTTHVG
jgi:hypothetical protein